MPDRLLFRNGLLALPAGFTTSSILIEGPVIAHIGDLPDAIDAPIIDCTGLVVAPGFIDAHSHSDLQVLANKREKSLQGVTSEVVGNCGFSAYPNQRPAELQEFGNGILFGENAWGWSSAADYLLEVHSQARLASVFSLVGHGSLRIAHAGLKQGELDETTLNAMKSTLSDALSEGAVGFSTGLMYAPGSSAPASELEMLCEVVAKHDKIYCTHMRDYSTHLLEAIDEQVELARRTSCRLQISHLQTVGRANWRLNSLALERIEAARNSGVDVMFDCYPYVAGSTVLTQLLPQWALDGGAAALVERLTNPKSRGEIASQVTSSMVHEWSDIFISAVGSPHNTEVVGKSLEELANERRQSPLEVVFQLLIEEQGAVNMLQFNQSADNLRSNLTHPLAIIISDGFYVKGRPHPRLHGTFPELLGNICREQKWMTLPEAIYKVTAAPAERFGIRKRGFLREGYIADITIFDPAGIRSRSTYKEPELAPEGISCVIREGKTVWRAN